MLLVKGVDLLALPLDRALNVIYSTLMSTAKDDKERFRIENQLQRPIPGLDKPQDDPMWAHADTDGAAFLAAMGQQQMFLSG